MNELDQDWPRTYFNYFTEVEEHFQRVRGTHLFLMSPLDWALVEVWKDSGVPLEAVLRGIDEAFAKWRARKSKAKIQHVNSLAYCAQAVLAEAQAMAGAAPAASGQPAEPLFSLEELRGFLERNAAAVRAGGYPELAASLERLAAESEAHYQDLRDLDQRLTVLEEKMISSERARMSEEEMLAARRELEAELRQYRGKMSGAELAMLEKNYLDRRVLARARLPRLSLYYLLV